MLDTRESFAFSIRPFSITDLQVKVADFNIFFIVKDCKDNCLLNVWMNIDDTETGDW